MEYAKSKGGRLPTLGEAVRMMRARGGKRLYPGDMWVAVTTRTGRRRDWF